MRYVVHVGDVAHTVEIQDNGHQRRVILNGRALEMDWQFVGAKRSRLDAAAPHADEYSLLVGDRSYAAYVGKTSGAVGEGTALTLELMISGRPYVATVEDERTRTLASLAGGKHLSGDAAISAPMPGLVTNVLAEAGTEVARGQTVIVLEAMKMENDLTAPRAGIVKQVSVSKGQAVNQGDLLAVVGDLEGETPDEDETGA